MFFLNKKQLASLLDYASLISKLEAAFQSDYTVPTRSHYNFANPKEERESTLLLMPAWEAGKYVGVKLIIVAPNNGKYDLPSIQGTYTLFDAHKGTPLAQMDAKELTNRRTAAASALASRFLSREDSRTLLVVGTGSLAPYLVAAHRAVRNIEQVYIWGRRFERAKTVAQQVGAKAIKDLASAVPEADIISCATLSQQPLVLGKWLRAGQHLDLVGSYRKDMRETDNPAICKSRIYVDTLEGATKESGDLVIPLQNGLIQKSDLIGDLFGLCRSTCLGRQSNSAITLFKSVGHALEDLAAAQLAYERI